MQRVEVKQKSYPSNLLDKDWSKRKVYYPPYALKFIEQVYEMEVKDDDVWVVTLPKCGTTWAQEMVWLIINNYDFEAAKAEHLEVRSPFLEFDFLVYGDLERSMKPIEALKQPRLIKSHLPLPLLPKQLWEKKPKTIYVYRNPKDALVSEYYHARSVGREMDKTVEQSVTDYIEQSSLTHRPFEHVIEFYQLRNEPWLYFTSYERMKKNLREVIQDVCEFLNKPITEDQMQQMLHHLSFEEMKKNDKVQHNWEFDQVRKLKQVPYEKHNFVRKGKVDVYKEELSPELIAKLDAWIEENLAGYNLTLNELLLLND